MPKIPVMVITGFLGSGKTTLVRHLLRNNQGRRIAVLVNEFGEVGIDGDILKSCQVCDEDESMDSASPNILELANGCLCCTVQEEFLPTMQELLKRRDDIDCIVIETSGLAATQAPSASLPLARDSHRSHGGWCGNCRGWRCTGPGAHCR